MRRENRLGSCMRGCSRSERAKTALVFAGIASVALYGLGDLASGLLYHGYTFRDQRISENCPLSARLSGH